MNRQQLSILNSLVTFAAEHIPGGLSEKEQEVAQIVGEWALKGRAVDPRVMRMFEKASEMTYMDDDGKALKLIDELQTEMEQGREPFSRIKYTPVFVGFTRNEENLVIYKNVDNESELHIRLSKPRKGSLGPLQALGPDGEIQTQFDTIHDQFTILVRSPQFTGEAVGQRLDLLKEDGIRVWEP